jgi:hypothetical protein
VNASLSSAILLGLPKLRFAAEANAAGAGAGVRALHCTDVPDMRGCSSGEDHAELMHVTLCAFSRAELHTRAIEVAAKQQLKMKPKAKQYLRVDFEANDGKKSKENKKERERERETEKEGNGESGKA